MLRVPAAEPLSERERALAAELQLYLEECSDLDANVCEDLAQGFVRWAKAEGLL